jgi:hypothetical protein
MSPEPGTVAFWFGYRWFLIRHKVAYVRREWPWWLAMRLPRRVALMAFIRVYGVIGRCDDNFGEICDEWERRSAGGKPPTPVRASIGADGYGQQDCQPSTLPRAQQNAT